MKHAFLVAATHSGAGKTTLSLALLAALQERGFALQACKVGPDFIDPSHHALFTGRPSYNVDAWMGGETGMQHVYRHMLMRSKPDIVLAEGVMGLFDGAYGLGGPGSSAHCAHVLQLPIVLVLNVRGMGQSVAAMASGFVRAQPHLSFAGIICTHVGSENHKNILEESFYEVFDSSVPVLGYVPYDVRFDMPSRHLGLQMPFELFWTAEKRAHLAAWAEENLRLDALLAASLCTCAEPAFVPQVLQSEQRKVRIGIAYDAAFSFLYADMAAVLEDLGAQCVFFSPLHDDQLPPQCTALYFPGGYPELFAESLAQNTSMIESIRAFAAENAQEERTGRIYAECGGYMYLMQYLEYQEKKYPMCGLLPVSSVVGKQKAALGYRQVRLKCAPNIQGRGHEFHYGRVHDAMKELSALSPLWEVEDRKGKSMHGEVSGIAYKNIWASWIHMYPEGARQLLARIFNLTNAKDGI